MKCTKAAIRRTMTAIVFVVPIVFVAAVAANASQDRAIPGARNQSAGTACLAKPTLSERLEFATLEQARRILGRPDDWARQLSVFDRGARMRTLEPATTQELLQYLSSTARAWAPAEEAYWSVLAGQLSDALAGLNLRVPRAFMVKSSGRDENNAVYVRNRSIVLPEERLQIAGDMRRDFFLLAHELFHLLSAESPALRHALYGLLGFERFAKFEYPLELEERRLSNPGAHSYDHALAVETPDGPADVVPVIQSRIPLEEFIQLPTSGPPAFFAVLDIVLLPVDLQNGDVIRAADGTLITYGFGNTDWPARMLRNSSFIIHPEELMADNFALLMEWRRDGVFPIATPSGFPVNDVGLLTAMEEILTASCDGVR